MATAWSWKTTRYFNPRSPHGERLAARLRPADRTGISIHAPRTGSDVVLAVSCNVFLRFQSTLPARGATDFRVPFNARFAISIHAPRTGSDVLVAGCTVGSYAFQSTLPARGATHLPLLAPPAGDISIHAPRTGSDTPPAAAARSCTYFNPRSPHGERPVPDSIIPRHKGFQSTLPARGATAALRPHSLPPSISIHAPRTGSDLENSSDKGS